MAILLNDSKINSMLGIVNDTATQTTGAISQIEQWNSLAQNINSILDKIISLKGKQTVNNPELDDIPKPTDMPKMENKVIPEQTQQKQIIVDNQILKQKILVNLAKLKNLPEDIQNKTIKEFVLLAEQNPILLDSFIPIISQEIKECIRWN